jgi:TIR domain
LALRKSLNANDLIFQTVEDGSTKFGPKQIFMDIDAIAPGEDFVKAIEETVAKCDVLIAVVGNNWLTSKDEQGGRRLDNPDDFVRMEIATALKREIRVIPVLVDGASMPRTTELPDDLRPLVRRNALRVSDTSFDGDCQRLVSAITEVLEKVAAESSEREKQQPSRHSGKPEVAKPYAKPSKVVDPLQPQPTEPKHVEPKPGETSPRSKEGTRGKSLSKQLIIAFAAAAALLVGGVIFLASRPHESLSSQQAPISASPSQFVIATPTSVPTSLPVVPARLSPSISTPPTPRPTANELAALKRPPPAATRAQ